MAAAASNVTLNAERTAANFRGPMLAAVILGFTAIVMSQNVAPDAAATNFVSTQHGPEFVAFPMNQTITAQEHIDRMLVASCALRVGFTDEFSIRIAGFGGASEVYHALPHFPADSMGWWRHIFGLAPHLYRNGPVLQGNVAAEATTGAQTVFLRFFTWMAKVCKGHGAAVNMVFPGLGALIIGGGCLMTAILARCDMSSNGERTAVRQFSPTAPLLPGQ
jgi:hypothetical protein